MQRLETREPALEPDLADIVVVQIHERDAQVRQHVEQARGLQQVLRVAPVAGPLGNHDLARARSQKGLGGRADDGRVRVDRGPALVLDEIRLQEHASPCSRRRTNRFQASEDDVGQVALVIRRGKQRHLRCARDGEVGGRVGRAPAAGRYDRPGGQGRQECAAADRGGLVDLVGRVW